MSEPVVLGIESTCDETAAAIVRGRELLSNVVASSMEEHARYGGVIPEIAPARTPRPSCHACPRRSSTRT